MENRARPDAASAIPIFVETYRATVAPSDCDHLGHMNVQHYFAAVSDGMFAIMVRLGLGPEESAGGKFALP
jgi:acyl-CoA thioesterase FadM